MIDRNKMHLILKILVLPLLALSAVSCNLNLMKSEYLEVVIRGESFSISWDDDTLSIGNKDIRTDKYRVYYRSHGTSTWNFLDTVSADSNPEYTFYISDLGPGRFDLGVSAVNIQGIESARHSSLDMTADPFCGWYVNWIDNK
ncbi:MAG: fibronectin type III domain-containing protein [Spirochaetales bacterium]|nr:fibronectin type III domain-containing protein [Spirochaetales bacterium]